MKDGAPVERHVAKIVGLLLIVGTAALYWPVREFEFIGLDDNLYVTENRDVQKGLSPENLQWVFSGANVGFYYHPLALLSHMVDCHLFGLNAGRHHLVSLLLHVLNTWLLFHVLHRSTGHVWPSAAVAALFAWHPLHIESVAWIASRKDVLSTSFWMLGLWAYVRYAEKRTKGRYFLVLLFFGLGLLAKPMLVTFPCVLLLMDVWPLRRLEDERRDSGSGTALSWQSARNALPGLVREKIPLLLLTAIASVGTAWAKKAWAAPEPLENFHFLERLAYVPIAYVIYLRKTLWPSDLAIHYQVPNTMALEQTLMSLIVLLIITAVVVRWIGRFPYLSVGWFWFLGTLAPVIGFVRIGTTAIADRYTYVPLIGIFIAAAFGWRELLRLFPRAHLPVVSSACAAVLACVLAGAAELQRWRNNITLFTPDLWYTRHTAGIQAALGGSYQKLGRVPEARLHYTEAIRLDPTYATPHIGLGVMFHSEGKTDEAIAEFQKALQKNPNSYDAHFDLGLEFEKQGKREEAIRFFGNALKIRPESSDAHASLAVALAEGGELTKALEHFKAAVTLNPRSADLRYNLGNALLSSGRLDEAMSSFQEALRIHPGHRAAQERLERLRQWRATNPPAK